MPAVYDDAFLARLEQGLRMALPRWGLSNNTELRLLTISENATFGAHEPTTDRSLVFRVHRPGYHTRAEIESELAWLAALRRDHVVPTPAAIAQRDGDLIADIDDGGILRHAVAFEFMSGKEPAEGEDLTRWFRELGAINARLHRHAKSWQRPDGFVRKVWNYDAMLGAAKLWGDWRAAPGLDEAGRSVLERAASRLRDLLDAYGTGEERFGLIHADMRIANLLVDDRTLSVIDFDDCGFGWYLYDFAAAISFIEHESYVPTLQAAWIEGYRTVAPIPDDDCAMLPVFVMLRRMLLTAWIASHAETPTAQQMGAAYTHGTVALAHGFLETCDAEPGFSFHAEVRS